MIVWQFREKRATGRFFKRFLKRVPPKSEGVIVDEGPSPMRMEKGVQRLTD